MMFEHVYMSPSFIGEKYRRNKKIKKGDTMKKSTSCLLALVMLFSLVLASCTSPATSTPEPTVEQVVTEEPAVEPVASDVDVVKIATLAGPTGMGLIGVINDNSGKYEVEILSMPDQIVPKIVSNEVDFATIPSNLASVLYNKTEGAISIVAINTFGVLYIVDSTGEVTELADLEGKTLSATGLGASPEYVLTKILAENGLTNGENITVDFMPSHSDLSNAVAAGDAAIGMLPEPFVSMTLAKAEGTNVVISLNEEWEKIFGEGAQMPMGVTVVQNSFLEAHPDLVAQMMEDYQASVDYVHSETEQAAADMVAAGIIGNQGIALQAIPRCEISFVVGEEAQTMVDTFLNVLFESNPKSVGGTVPGGDFYYIQN
jgi:NitT/TauT family transport system substrate-binding protein